MGQFDPAKVARLKDEVELSGLPRVRETIMDARKIVENAAKKEERWTFKNPPVVLVGVLAGMDRLGRLIVPIPMGDMITYNQLSAVMRPMTEVMNKDGKEYAIQSVELLYTDKIPTHWFVGLEDA